MAWVAVDKNGDELITHGQPKRLVKYGTWEFLDSAEGEVFHNAIYLPHASIEKLIGKVLTWDDEAVDIGD